ncbi:MAG: hypothetical protein EBU23_10010, partial [Mycobacteriaceae bacterium]|nr:hypothetical protein [Mycobacteriaceae bacterium]
MGVGDTAQDRLLVSGVALHGADVRVDEALGGIDVQLTRRAALIPGLVGTVQGYATHEKAVLGRITDAQVALTAATAGTSV